MPGNSEVHAEDSQETEVTIHVPADSWTTWASDNKQVVWGIAAGSIALVLGFAVRSLTRSRVYV